MSETRFAKQDFYGKMESLLNLPAGSVTGDTALSSLKNWDSLTILEFMVIADSDYSSDIDPTQISSCQTVDQLAELTFAGAGSKA